MSKERLVIISVILLSISMIISSIIISKGLRMNGESIRNGLDSVSYGAKDIGTYIYNSRLDSGKEDMIVTKNTFDLDSSSIYLGIDREELLRIISTKESGIPYVKIGDKYIFTKNSLDKWLETVQIEVK